MVSIWLQFATICYNLLQCTYQTQLPVFRDQLLASSPEVYRAEPRAWTKYDTGYKPPPLEQSIQPTGLAFVLFGCCGLVLFIEKYAGVSVTVCKTLVWFHQNWCVGL